MCQLRVINNRWLVICWQVESCKFQSRDFWRNTLWYEWDGCCQKLTFFFCFLFFFNYYYYIILFIFLNLTFAQDHCVSFFNFVEPDRPDCTSQHISCSQPQIFLGVGFNLFTHAQHVCLHFLSKLKLSYGMSDTSMAASCSHTGGAFFKKPNLHADDHDCSALHTQTN